MKTGFAPVALLVSLTVAGCAWMPLGGVSGKAVYDENCAMCHGPTGQGDGPLADELFQRPTDLTMLSATNGGVFPSVTVISHIDGYVRGENSSGAMPEFGPLLVGDNVLLETGDGVVTPTPEPLLAVARYLETLQVVE